VAIAAPRKAAPATPIVAAFVADPVGNGLVTAGGTVAALDAIPADLAAKQVQLLREIVPGPTAWAWCGTPAIRLHGALPAASRKLPIATACGC
jgi:hypothetical protein